MTSKMRDPSDAAEIGRRGLLRALASLPLIGGAVSLVGNPTAAAEPISRDLLDSYDCWLHCERRWLQFERHRANPDAVAGVFRTTLDGLPYVDRDGAGYDFVPMNNGGARFHSYGTSATPSTRAAIVLAAVGCDWREEGR